MKKLYLIKSTQFDKVCYIGRIDPRKLVKIATKVEMNTTQDAQRPLSEKRVKDIVKYVADERGILPNTLTLAANNNKINVKPVEGIEGLYYMDFPETKEEYLDYIDSIDVMDGQHRLYSFRQDLCKMSEDDPYEIGFTLYIRPSLRDKQKIFISCNEKQEKVSNNLLLWFRSKLNMLQTEEKERYSLVSKLNESYPLKDHIIMSAESIKNGIKAKELMEVIKKSKIDDMSFDGRRLSEDEKSTVICRYLSAWENVVDFSFTKSKAKEAGPAIKISGLRFMLYLLPCIWDRSVQKEEAFTQEFVEDVLKRMIADMGVEREMFFLDEKNKATFYERSQTIAFANECEMIIKSIGSKSFNPLA